MTQELFCCLRNFPLKSILRFHHRLIKGDASLCDLKSQFCSLHTFKPQTGVICGGKHSIFEQNGAT